MLFKKSLLYLSLPAIVVSLLQSCPGAPAQSQNDIDIKKRLKQAATKDDKPLMKELIISAAPDDLNVADALDEDTALLMLSRGADANKLCELCHNGFPNDSNITALHAAAKWNSLPLIDALIAKGAKIDAISSNMYRTTPLHIAAYDGDSQIVERLLKAGAKPNLISAYGNALSCAMTGLNEGYWRDDDRNERYLSVIKLLIASGADVNGGRGANSEPSVKDMVLRNKNAEFMQQLREAVGMTKADNPTGGLTSQQITTTLTTTKLANLADLAPLIKSGDSSVRSRALDLVNELAGDEKIGGALVFFLAELERQGGGATKLLNREVFSPQLISAVILATDDPQSNVRIKALQAFRSIDEVEENIIKVVTNKLASDSEPGVKVAAAGTLVSFAMTQKQDMTTLVEKKLESALLQAKDAKARIGIAMALNFIHLQHRDATTKTSLNEASPTKVLTMEFGRAYDVPELEMKSTKVIPCYHDDHQQASYRFCMVLDSRQKAPNITIKLILPAKRTDWSFGHNFLVPGYDPVYVKGSDGTWEHGKFKSNGAVKVSADGKTGTYKNVFTQGARGVWGLYAASWPTDAETIPGKYRLEVYFNDKLEKAFDFELVKTKAKS